MESITDDCFIISIVHPYFNEKICTTEMDHNGWYDVFDGNTASTSRIYPATTKLVKIDIFKNSF